MIDTTPQNPDAFTSEVIQKILIASQSSHPSIAVLIIYAVLLLALLCATIYFTRTALWINFATANKWKSRIAICGISILAIFFANTIGGYVGSQIKGKLRFGAPDIISTSLKLGSYGLVYNAQATTNIPKEQRDLFYCAKALANEDIKKILEKNPDALDTNMLITPMSKESILDQIKSLQTGDNKSNPKLGPCFKVNLSQY